jgi:hypothetical protein
VQAASSYCLRRIAVSFVLLEWWLMQAAQDIEQPAALLHLLCCCLGTAQGIEL